MENGSIEQLAWDWKFQLFIRFTPKETFGRVSETAKGALRGKDEGICLTEEAEIDQKRQRQSQKAEKIDFSDVCKYSKILLSVRYIERENNKIVTLGPNQVSVSP